MQESGAYKKDQVTEAINKMNMKMLTEAEIRVFSTFIMYPPLRGFTHESCNS